MINEDFRPISWPQENVVTKPIVHKNLLPKVNRELCVSCNICWLYCPEGVIRRDTIEINLDKCKGCGICATECHKHAITMERGQ